MESEFKLRTIVRFAVTCVNTSPSNSGVFPRSRNKDFQTARLSFVARASSTINYACLGTPPRPLQWKREFFSVQLLKIFMPVILIASSDHRRRKTTLRDFPDDYQLLFPGWNSNFLLMFLERKPSIYLLYIFRLAFELKEQVITQKSVFNVLFLQ